MNHLIKSDKLIKHMFTYFIKIVNLLFWVIFCCIVFLMIIISTMLWEDWINGLSVAGIAFFSYIMLLLGIIISFLYRIAYLHYIFAFGIILLFLYLANIPELSHNFVYFNLG